MRVLIFQNVFVDADSSQAIVIEEARGGRNLVVRTGKSQTITNAIASAVHSGKTVLFAAEKAAAMEVVHDRLRNAGLGALCLELHSRKANKGAVVKSPEQALRFSSAAQIDAISLLIVNGMLRPDLCQTPTPSKARVRDLLSALSR